MDILHEAGGHGLAYWAVFGWYMVGALLRGAYMLLGWYRGVRDKECKTWAQEVAHVGQKLIVSVVVAVVWVGGHVWALMEMLGTQIPESLRLGTHALANVSVGFILEIILVERLMKWWGGKGGA